MVAGGADTVTDDLRREVEGLAHSWLRGDVRALAHHAAEGIVAIGTGPDDVFVGREALRAGLDRIPPAIPGHVDTGTLSVRAGLSAGGRSGWGWALGALSPRAGARRFFRLSVATAREQDGWHAVHLHASYGLPNEQVADYGRLISPLAPVGDRIHEDAAGLPPLLKANMGAGRLTVLADRPDVVVIGTDPNEIFEGATAYRETFEPMLPQIEQLEQTMRLEFPGGLTSELTPDGETGFVAGNVIANFGDDSLPAFRMAWVFTRVDGAFRLVCDHHSAAAIHEPE
jgi:hypothetical protein